MKPTTAHTIAPPMNLTAAARALFVYAPSGGVIEEVFPDLIADIMHLADVIDPTADHDTQVAGESILARAATNYQAEVDGTDNDPVALRGYTGTALATSLFTTDDLAGTELDTRDGTPTLADAISWLEDIQTGYMSAQMSRGVEVCIQALRNLAAQG